MTTSSLEYVSIGCNCLGDCLVWGRNGIAAYGAQNFVSLVDPKESKTLSTLIGHTNRVNHLQWIPNVKVEYSKRFSAPEDELVSCSSDKTIISWRRVEGSTTNYQYKAAQILKGHTDSVTSVSVLDYPDGSLLMCSTSADHTVKLWYRPSITSSTELPQWNLIQSFDFKPKCMECSSLAFLPGTTTPILALGGLEPKIHIYVQQNNNTTEQQQQQQSIIQFRRLVSLQGHQDWIKCLSFCQDKDDVYLASSSQDFKIRLWKLTKFNQQQQAAEESQQGDLISSLSTQLSGITSLSSKGHLFNVDNIKYSLMLESVLSGHDDWVYSVSWAPAKLVNGERKQDMKLLSSSMDKTMMIWTPDQSTGIWIDEVRVGDMGGNILGLYGGVFSSDHDYIFSHGYNGAFHLWKFSQDTKRWEPQITISGHFAPVQDLMWSPDNSYFISSSTDRTLRLHSEWVKKDDQTLKPWHEIARPQIHGYDLECFTFIFGKTHVIVSGAEEKIMRVFVGTQNFVDTLLNISNVLPINDGTIRPMAANQPSLGLSNKPYYSDQDLNNNDGSQQQQDMPVGGDEGEGFDTGYFEDNVPFIPVVLQQPPFEEHLLQSSLWPETFKLYGHGNEMISVCCSYDGKYLASACRASTADQATVRIWTVSNWKEVANLKGHTLTVVQLAFSHNNKYLLGVSRDRMWTLWQRTDNPEEPFVKVASAPKSHGRIIWSGSWTHDDQFFATGSRDKVVKIWNTSKITDKSGLSATLPTFGSGVNCVEFAPPQPISDNIYLLAVGEEDGKITIWRGDNNNDSNPINWNCIHTIDSSISHISEVKRIRWRGTPKKLNDNQVEWEIATCSIDHSVRLFKLIVNY
eukprot:gene974-1239_t